MIVVGVTGGRAVDSRVRDRVRVVLQELFSLGEPVTILHGGCPHPPSGGNQGVKQRMFSVDRLAAEEAYKAESPQIIFPARWSSEGKSAGPRRNKAMLEAFRPAFLIAFPGGSGTENAKTLAAGMGITVLDGMSTRILTLEDLS